MTGNKFTSLNASPQAMIDALVPLVDLAGDAIMKIYQQDNLEIEAKEDSSPLTQADIAANTILVRGLKSLWPNIPVLSEEGGDPFLENEEPIYFWAVDPLDGTKEFIQRNGEFTVNVALIFKGDPVLGVVLAPALDQLYWGYSNVALAFEGEANKKAMKRQAGVWKDIAVGSNDSKKLIRIASSRSHPSSELVDWLKQFASYEAIGVGSSLKFCLVAEGLIDIYPRFGPTCIWDTAAGHAVVNGAEGKLLTSNNEPITYKLSNIFNPNFFVYRFNFSDISLLKHE
jgi:3'(2'), 5'-bisphosphate nucleotidase